MGRRRKDNSLDLPSRVYAKHGAFFYVHPNGKWERLGTDLQEARRRGRHYNDPDDEHGTMKYWLNQFIIYCETRIGKPRSERGIKQRTYDDYKKDVELLIAYFGKMLPAQVEGHHVAEYLDIGAEAGRPIRANREKACLSSCFSWLRRKPNIGIKENPCFGIARNPEQKRERYVEHAEYKEVFARAAPSVQALMGFVYRTLQRPEDIIRWTADDITLKMEPNGKESKIIRVSQNKTGAGVHIAITPDLEAILNATLPPESDSKTKLTLIRSRHGKPYGYSGLSSMFRRYVATAVKEGKIAEPFTLYDLKGKGATDMWLSKVPLEQIQQLCGHDSVTTTEKYVKCRWRGTISPNSTVL